jgi:hypothetical protein
MMKKLSLLAILLILGGLAVFFQINSYNNRHAENLSAYCHIDFRGVKSDSIVNGATLQLTDFRFFAAKLEPAIELTIDGKSLTLPAATNTQTKPTLTVSDFGEERCFKYESSLFIEFPPELLQSIAKASNINVTFNYTDGTSIDLPLSQPDLKYWKNQLTPQNL